MKRCILMLIALACWPLPSQAQSPEEKGLAIAKEQERRDTGWGDSRADMVMTLRNRHGEEAVRQMKTRELEGADDGDKSLMVFLNPPDVAGTALLTHSHKNEDDDQWLYLPALKRVKRISGSNKSGSFMGSEFSYEDLGGREVPKYDYRFIAEEACPCPGLEEVTCMVNESYPHDGDSGYTRIKAWVDAKEYRTCKAEFYDRKESHLKTLVMKNFKQFKGNYWRAMRMDMQNHQTMKSTTLEFSNYAFGNGFTEADFNRNALKRTR